MGYRTFLASMPKKEYNKIKSLTRDQLVEFYNKTLDEDGYFRKSAWEYGTNIHGFGTPSFDVPKKMTKTFFKNKELNNYYTKEDDFYIVSKEFLEYIIKFYTTKVEEYYNDMLNPFIVNGEQSDFLKSVKYDIGITDDEYTFDFTKITPEQQTALWKIIWHMKSFQTEWVHLTPYDLFNNDPSITTSWKFEYNVFELVRIYKTFDWKRNVMIYYGY